MTPEPKKNWRLSLRPSAPAPQTEQQTGPAGGKPDPFDIGEFVWEGTYTDSNLVQAPGARVVQAAEDQDLPEPGSFWSIGTSTFVVEQVAAMPDDPGGGYIYIRYVDDQQPNHFTFKEWRQGRTTPSGSSAIVPAEPPTKGNTVPGHLEGWRAFGLLDEHDIERGGVCPPVRSNGVVFPAKQVWVADAPPSRGKLPGESRNTNGLYAYHSRELLERDNGGLDHYEVIGEIKASGRVVRGTKGLRAEKMYVKAFHIRTRKYIPLLEKYGVPIILEKVPGAHEFPDGWSLIPASTRYGGDRTVTLLDPSDNEMGYFAFETENENSLLFHSINAATDEARVHIEAYLDILRREGKTLAWSESVASEHEDRDAEPTIETDWQNQETRSVDDLQDVAKVAEAILQNPGEFSEFVPDESRVTWEHSGDEDEWGLPLFSPIYWEYAPTYITLEIDGWTNLFKQFLRELYAGEGQQEQDDLWTQPDIEQMVYEFFVILAACHGGTDIMSGLSTFDMKSFPSVLTDLVKYAQGADAMAGPLPPQSEELFNADQYRTGIRVNYPPARFALEFLQNLYDQTARNPGATPNGPTPKGDWWHTWNYEPNDVKDVERPKINFPGSLSRVASGEERTKWSDILRMAESELRDAVTHVEGTENLEESDTIHEIADGCVPVYNSTLLELAADNNELATFEPELGGGESLSPIRAIQLNCYEFLTHHLYEVWQKIVEEEEEYEQDREDALGDLSEEPEQPETFWRRPNEEPPDQQTSLTDIIPPNKYTAWKEAQVDPTLFHYVYDAYINALHTIHDGSDVEPYVLQEVYEKLGPGEYSTEEISQALEMASAMISGAQTDMNPPKLWYNTDWVPWTEPPPGIKKVPGWGQAWKPTDQEGIHNWSKAWKAPQWSGSFTLDDVRNLRRWAKVVPPLTVRETLADLGYPEEWIVRLAVRPWEAQPDSQPDNDLLLQNEWDQRRQQEKDRYDKWVGAQGWNYDSADAYLQQGRHQNDRPMGTPPRPRYPRYQETPYPGWSPENEPDDPYERGRSKPVRSTRLVRIAPDEIGVKLHDTHVLRFKPGLTTYNTGGWYSRTTKDRMNYGPHEVFSRPPSGGEENPNWYVSTPMTKAKSGGEYSWKDWAAYPYFDGMTITDEGELLNPEDYREPWSRAHYFSNWKHAEYGPGEIEEWGEPWSPVPKFQPGDQVVFRSGNSGTVIEEAHEFEGDWWYRIQTATGIVQASEDAMMRPDEYDHPGDSTMQDMGIPPEGEDYYRNASRDWNLHIADYQGWTNWDTWHTALLMDNDEPLYHQSRKLMENGMTVEELRDWCIKNILGSHNRQEIEDAQEWNDIPEHERPRDEDSFDGGTSDTTPMLMDEHRINWQEIWDNLYEEIRENIESEQMSDKAKHHGIEWYQPGSDPTSPHNLMYDAWMKHHGIMSQTQRLPNGLHAGYHTILQLTDDQLPSGKKINSDYWGREGYEHTDKRPMSVDAYGWDTVGDIQRGRVNPYQAQTMQQALAEQGHSPEQIAEIMKQRWHWDGKNWQDLEPKEPDNRALDQPGDLTLPSKWTSLDDEQPPTHEPGYMYHVAPQSARQSIFEDGLVPAYGGTTNWNESDYESVYLLGSLTEARDWIKYSTEMGQNASCDIWAVDISGMEVAPDPMMEGQGWDSYVAPAITPDRLSLVTAKTSMAGDVSPDYWTQGGCAEYALALHDRNPKLQFGRHVVYDEDQYGDEDDEPMYSTNHVFVHDDKNAYDALGTHPLPYDLPEHQTLYGIPRDDIEAEWDNDPEMVEEAHRQIEDGTAPVQREWRTSMAERTGDPQLDDLIQEFMTGAGAEESMDDDGSIEWLRHPDEAEGYCSAISMEFASFLNARGIKAYDSGQHALDERYPELHPERANNPFMNTDHTPDAFGYNDRTRPSDYDQHSATVVEMPSGTYVIDWAASQYGYKEFPMVQRLDNSGGWQREWKQSMAERSGDPELDKLIEEFAASVENRELWTSAEAEGMCEQISQDFEEFLKKRGIPSEVKYMESSPERSVPSYEEMGYGDTPERDRDWHAVVQVVRPSGTYNVDFTAAQYGYTEFPMVQRLDNSGGWQREWESKTAMAERTGDPQLDALIEKFMQSEWNKDEWPDSWEELHTMGELSGDWGSPVPIEKFRHPGISEGQCWEMAEHLATFLSQHGFNAYTSDDVSTGNPNVPGTERFPWKGEESQDKDFGLRAPWAGEGEFVPHNWTIVDTPSGTYGIDFTASQFGESEFPMVQKLDGKEWKRS